MTDVTFGPVSSEPPEYIFTGSALFKRDPVTGSYRQLLPEEWPQPCDCEECQEAFREIDL